MSRVVHYRFNGGAVFCREVGAIDHATAFAESMSGRTSTDIRRVTCPLCLHAMAASMIRKGVPIKFTPEGKAFCDQHLTANGGVA